MKTRSRTGCAKPPSDTADDNNSTRKPRKKKAKKRSKEAIRAKERDKKRIQRKRLREIRRKHEAAKSKERERWHKRKKEGKIKKPEDFSRRELKDYREKRKLYNRRYYQKKKEEKQHALSLSDTSDVHNDQDNDNASLVSCSTGNSILVSCSTVNSSLDSCSTGNSSLVSCGTDNVIPGRSISSGSSVSSKKLKGLKRLKSNRSKVYRLAEKLQTQVQSLQRKLWVARKRATRLKGKMDLTPRSKVNKIVKGKKVNPAVKKKLLFNEVLCSQIKTAAEAKSDKSKQLFHRLVAGQVIKKCRMLNQAESTLSLNRLRKAHTSFANSPATVYQRKPKTQRVTNLKNIEHFF